jgi:class 3 adenylate cyclase
MTSVVDSATAGHPCADCGRAAHAPRFERRVVSILFADIVGFTSLVDGLAPEEVWALQNDYFRTVARVIRTEGGVVEKYIGDAVLAIFGSAAVDGHESFRAVQAGLRLQERLDGRSLAGRYPVRTRVGIATGEALVDVAAADGGQAMVSGAVVTSAARLQAYAPHGTVVVCGYTRHATASVVAYQDLPPVAVPGKPRPLDLWRALPRLGEPARGPARRRTVRG